MRKSLIVCLIIFVALAASYAEDRKEKEGFWSRLKNKIETITPKKKVAVTTAVGGVRSATDESANVLYWKGREIDAQIAPDELDKFKVSLENAINGNMEESQKLFHEFLTQYPQSPLREDAIKALENLKAVE